MENVLLRITYNVPQGKEKLRLPELRNVENAPKAAHLVMKMDVLVVLVDLQFKTKTEDVSQIVIPLANIMMENRANHVIHHVKVVVSELLTSVNNVNEDINKMKRKNA